MAVLRAIFSCFWLWSAWLSTQLLITINWAMLGKRIPGRPTTPVVSLTLTYFTVLFRWWASVRMTERKWFFQQHCTSGGSLSGDLTAFLQVPPTQLGAWFRIGASRKRLVTEKERKAQTHSMCYTAVVSFPPMAFISYKSLTEKRIVVVLGWIICWLFRSWTMLSGISTCVVRTKKERANALLVLTGCQCDCCHNCQLPITLVATGDCQWWWLTPLTSWFLTAG